MSDTDKIVGFAKGMNLNNDEFLAFLQNTEYSEKTLDNYQKYMQKSASATSKFGAALKSIGANIAIMLAINLAIKAVSIVWDEFNDTVAESQEKIDGINSKINELTSEIEYSFFSYYNNMIVKFQ